MHTYLQFLIGKIARYDSQPQSGHENDHLHIEGENGVDGQGWKLDFFASTLISQF